MTTAMKLIPHECRVCLLVICLFTGIKLNAQTAANNYIVTYTPRVPISAASTLPTSTVARVNQAVQYIDGLGRPNQTVQTKASPSQRDIVQPIAYDQYDREAIKYLPYVDSATSTNYGTYKTTAFADQASFYANPTSSKWNSPAVVTTPYPTNTTLFESSPLSRPLEQGFAGDNWQLTGTAGPTNPGHTVKMLYAGNDATSLTSGDGYWAQKYTVVYSYPTGQYDYRNSLANSGAYPAHTLFVTITKNENWLSTQSDTTLNTTQEYKDLFGRIVLKRTINYNASTSSREVLSTYYVYDDYNNLIYVLPPGAQPDNGGITQAQLDNQCYQYRYDGRNRVIYKKVPGKGWDIIIYNNLNQAIANQDSIQRMANPQQVSYAKYDSQGRTIMTGIYTISGSSPGTDYRVTLQANADTESAYWETRSSSGAYSNVTMPTSNATILTTNYYDDYNIPGLPSTYTVTSGVSVMTRGLLTASQTAVLNSPADMLWTVQYYDDLGRTIESFSQHYLGGHTNYSTNNYDLITNTYNFTNQITTTTRKHFNVTNTTTPLVTVANSYIYDHVGRKQKTWETITNGTTPTSRTLIAQTVYNQLGQLSTKKLNSTDSVNFYQNISYTYNERGWLLKSTAPLFEMQLQYNKVTGIIGISPVAQYNGNIASQSWGTSVAQNSSSTVYSYDNLNRLTAGNNVAGYNENGISYDLMGNIATLRRYTSSASLIDQLAYTYASGTNQLQSVADNSGSDNGLVNGTTTYTYDGNGNLLNAGNTINNLQNKSFTYNLLNLPLVVTKPIGTITYTYDATGNKLRKVTVLSGVTKSTDYINGIEYDNSTTSIGFIQTDVGKAVPISTGYNYTYYLGDNLGNTRITFDTKTGVAAMVQQDDYYPFGLEIPGTIPSPKNEYLYNKKELQEETGQYDYGARFYDPVIGRWSTIDPMAEISRRWSTYNYGEDSPIKNVDPDGMEVVLGGGDYGGDLYTGAEARNLFAQLRAQQQDGGKKKGGEKKGGTKRKFILITPANAPHLKPVHGWAKFFADLNGGRDYNGINYDDDGNPTGVSQIKIEFPWYVSGPGEAAEVAKLWAFWSDYEKVVVNGTEYAKIGERLFTRHAVERMVPSGLGKAAGGVVGRSISPNIVEEVITNGVANTRYVDGVLRTEHVLGTVHVVTEQAGKIVVTVITK